MSTAEKYLRPEVIRQVSRLDLRAKFIVQGFLTGLHSSPLHGASVEFSEHRKYVAGDDPKDPKFRAPSQMSESVGVASITLFHPAFTKVHPGFDLTSPRLLSPKELEGLAHELTEMAMSLLSATDLAVAKARWGKHSAFVRELEGESVLVVAKDQRC